jgi:GNAT superfamily N-acetyltransferase
MSFDPGTFAVRLAEQQDADALARVIDCTWHDAYQSVLPPAAFDELPPECTAGHWDALLARVPEDNVVLAAVDEDDDPVGVASAGPDRFGGRTWAEIYSLYVMPGYQRLGLGRRLLSRAFRMMHEAGYESGLVWTLTQSTSHGFYERLGGAARHRRESTDWGATLPQTGYVWPDLGASFGGEGALAGSERKP